MKKPNATVFQALVLVRTIGVKIGVLPRNFPAANKIALRVVGDAKLDYAGAGGLVPVNGKLEPFVLINLAHNVTLQYIMATMAHELLHIQQARAKLPANHDNKFRADCAAYGKALGAPYYLVFGYDAPSEKTCIAYGKRRAAWYRSFIERNARDRANGGYNKFLQDEVIL